MSTTTTPEWQIKRLAADRVEVTHNATDYTTEPPRTSTSTVTYTTLGDYVHSVADDGRLTGQACRGLLPNGPTLMHQGRDLADIIARTLRIHRFRGATIEIIAHDRRDQPVSLRLILDVTYNPNGVPVAELERMLEQNAKHGYNVGLLTGSTAAEVETWDCRVERPA